MRAPQEERAVGTSLTVMTYNIQGYGALVSRRYIEGIARTIRRASPDIVGLQEVHRGTWPARFGDQVDRLAELTGMDSGFGRSLELGRGEYGNAVLTRGRVVGQTVHALPGKAERRSLFHSRIALDGRELDFFVTHLAAWGRFARAARERQAESIVERLVATGDGSIVVGDLNAPPEAPELRALLGCDGLELCGEHGASTHRLMRGRLDYIFTQAPWRTIESRVLRAGPSDHFPVIARLERAPDGVVERVNGTLVGAAG